MVSHAAYHRRQICMLAYQLGFALPAKAAYGFWSREKLWRDADSRIPASVSSRSSLPPEQARMESVPHGFWNERPENQAGLPSLAGNPSGRPFIFNMLPRGQ